MSRFIMFTDGACSGNPGPASIGVVIYKDGDRFKEISMPIGEATNNVAEYSALIFGLQESLIEKISVLHVYTDSELLYKQLNGEYKVKDEKIKFLHSQVKSLIRGFQRVAVEHIPREKNKEADKLATSALKVKRTTAVASLFDNNGEESPSSKG